MLGGSGTEFITEHLQTFYNNVFRAKKGEITEARSMQRNEGEALQLKSTVNGCVKYEAYD